MGSVKQMGTTRHISCCKRLINQPVLLALTFCFYVCHPVIARLPNIWTPSVSVSSTNTCDIGIRSPQSMSNLILQNFDSSLLLPVIKYSISPNRSESNTWSLVVSADRPYLTPWLAVLIMKAYVNSGDFFSQRFCLLESDFFLSFVCIV